MTSSAGPIQFSIFPEPWDTLFSMQLESTKQRLPYLDSAGYTIRQAAQIWQIRAKSECRDVRHAEKFYTAGIVRVWILCTLQGHLFFFQQISVYMLSPSFLAKATDYFISDCTKNAL